MEETPVSQTLLLLLMENPSSAAEAPKAALPPPPGTPGLSATPFLPPPPRPHACCAAILVCSVVFSRIQSESLTTLRSNRICVFCSGSFSRHVCAALRTALEESSFCSGLATRVPEGCSSVRGRSSGSRGRWQGVRRGSRIVKAAVLHAHPSWLGSHTIGHLEEQKRSPAAYPSCLLLSQRHSQRQDPLPSGGRWGPHRSWGLLYGPSSYQRWWNLWRTLFLQGVPVTHTPGHGLGPTRHESCSFRSLCSRPTHGRKYFLDVYPCQPWPKCRAKQVCTLNVHSEWTERIKARPVYLPCVADDVFV